MEKHLKNLCALPWIGIEARPNGSFKPCCLYKDTIKDDKGMECNTRTHTVEQAQNSKDMIELRRKFMEGEKPSACQACWKEEDSGKKSKRIHVWEKSPELAGMGVSKNIVKPIYIDLKLGNICNLKCRICAPNSSSQWVPDYIKLDPTAKKLWQSYNKMGQWPREKNAFLEDADNWLPYVRYFEITGGEPLMIQEQFDVLKKCIDLGVAKHQHVHYNTNGTQYPEEAVREIWPHFKKIELAYSIDDVGKRFEYQRKNANWQEVKTNIEKFKASGLKNLSTQVCTTINFFNILYLKEMAKQVKEWSPDFWYINVLHWPVEFDIQRLPQHVKDEITKELLGGECYEREIESAISYMSQNAVKEIDPFKDSDYNSHLKQDKPMPTKEELTIERMRSHKIKEIDELRKENFKDIFPELNNLVKIYD